MKPATAGTPTGSPARVTVFTLPGCIHCRRARQLLDKRRIVFSEVSMAGVPHFRAVLLELTGGSTVPQILFGEEPIGGAADLARLDRRGVLAARLAGERFPRAVRVRRLSVGAVLSWAFARSSHPEGPWRYRTELVDRDGRRVGGG